MVARRLRPNRPLGHCLNLRNLPSCDTWFGGAWIIGISRANIQSQKREIQKSGLDGILKGPGKLARCVVWWLQTSYPGALTPPLIPTLCTDKLYKKWGGRARVNPTWVKTPGFHQTSHISFSPSYISFIHLSIYKFCCESWTAHIYKFTKRSAGCQKHRQ